MPSDTEGPALFTLSSCSWLVPLNHLTLHPFDQSVSCTEWEQIAPTILLPWWLGSCTCEVPAQCASVPLLKKNLFGHQCRSEPLLGFPHFPALWEVQSLSQTWPVAAHLFSQLQVLPRFSPLSGTVLLPWQPLPQLGCATSCVCACLPPSTTAWESVHASPGAGLRFANPGRGGSC